ncbi:MAG: hypothetical protein N3A54_06410 [Patescibacteria group bacterium]|nr:hypothetical protein [Patescibacteria group bacterium]
MKKLMYAIAFFASLSNIYGDTHGGLYSKHTSEEYKYEILVPAHWSIDEITLPHKHIFISFYKDSEIRIRAIVVKDDNAQPILWKRRWNLRGIDPLLQEIIDTGNIRIRKNICDSLLVFEYRAKQKKMLQRTMICKNGNIIYIVDCKAPTNVFYRHEKHFNVALSSFTVIGKKDNTEMSGIDENNKLTPLPSHDSPEKTLQHKSNHQKTPHVNEKSNLDDEYF